MSVHSVSRGTPEALSKSLEEYFDDSFVSDVRALENLNSNYRSIAGSVEAQLRVLLDFPHRNLDIERLRTYIDSFRDTVALNLSIVQSKKVEPSKLVSLNSLAEITANIASLVEAANDSIRVHNELVKNRSNLRSRLIDEIWRYLLEEIKDELIAFEQRAGRLGKGISAINGKLEFENKEKIAKDAEIRRLEKQTTSIEPTIADINGELKKWGFSGFLLAKANKKGFYRLVREDGSPVEDTLSEGEKSFVTFLYFFRLLRGSNNESGTVGPRVVVVDDPVSSLDSNVLYVVSSLIKNLCQEVSSGQSQVVQIFVLTHNVYFHKEVTYRVQGSCKFWVVRKASSISKIEAHSSNPVKSSYELLWAELRREDPSKTTVQNTMRRILETYFKHFGGMDLDHIEALFDGQDKLVVRSLLSWMHDGSHSIHDDLHISSADSGVDEYFKVFKKIFMDTEHKAHYEMMMKVNPISISHA